MPLVALASFLQSRKLHLTRADGFSDLLEGRHGFQAMYEHSGRPFDDAGKAAVDAMIRDCFVSCWHLSHTESLAMWNGYGRGDQSSVAVVSTVNAVMHSADLFCADLTYCGMFGEVVYGDLVSDGKIKATTIGLPFGHPALPIPRAALGLFSKHASYDSEREWRLILWKKQSTVSSIQMPVPDLPKFLTKIVLSPYASDWIAGTVENLIRDQFGLADVAIERSPLTGTIRSG